MPLATNASVSAPYRHPDCAVRQRKSSRASACDSRSLCGATSGDEPRAALVTDWGSASGTAAAFSISRRDAVCSGTLRLISRDATHALRVAEDGSDLAHA